MIPGIHKSPAAEGQRGAALLSALLLVSLVAMIGVAVVDDIRFAVHRSTNAHERDQALRYAMGAETLARQIIHRSWQAQPHRSTLTDPWAAQGASFPIDGGVVSGGIRDGGNCFNLNSLGGPPDDAQAALSAAQFQNLATAVGLDADSAEALAAALSDWIDADTAPRPRGAEDAAYMRLSPPYRTGNTLVGDVSELRAVRGFSAAVYARLRPFVCAPPTTRASGINLNTLLPDQAPLLVMAFGPELSLAAARRMIETRPMSGYGRIDDALAARELASIEVPAAVRDQLALTTRRFVVETRVTYHAAEAAMTTWLMLDDSGRITVAARRLGDAE